MLVPSENHCHFKRIGNVLIEVLSTGEEVPVLKFKQHFIDVQKINLCAIDYLNRYIEMFPHLIEKIEIIIPEENSGEQLTLF